MSDIKVEPAGNEPVVEDDTEDQPAQQEGIPLPIYMAAGVLSAMCYNFIINGAFVLYFTVTERSNNLTIESFMLSAIAGFFVWLLFATRKTMSLTLPAIATIAIEAVMTANWIISHRP